MKDRIEKFAYWSAPVHDLVLRLETSPRGLSSAEAARRRTDPAEQVGTRRHSDVELLLRQFRSPLILLLLGAAAVSMSLSERLDSVIVIAIVIGSGLLGFVQERGALRSIEALRELVTVHSDVFRDAQLVETTVDEIVPGDVIRLDTGDVVPGDCIVLEANRLSVDESILTGEAFPVSKNSGSVEAETPISDRRNCLFLGSHVVSGSATALVVEVGRRTVFGAVERRVAERHLPTSFERGVTAYGLMLVEATAILVIGVFVLNLFLDRSLTESILFSLALAVGLAPQMLPAIVTLSLSIGARLLAARRVVVKRLDAIEDIGSIDVLCTDKTGTLTEGRVRVEGAFDVHGVRDDAILEKAYWNAHLQESHSNPIDDEISRFVGHGMPLPRRVAEIPFDFSRKLVSVVIEVDEARTLICKGAIEQVVARCSHARVGSEIQSIDTCLESIHRSIQELSGRGLRILGVAERSVDDGTSDELLETELVFLGFVAFADPAKESVSEALSRLDDLGVTVKIVTGDNREISRLTAAAVGLGNDVLLTGSDIASMSDEELLQSVDETGLFVEVDPLQKERIIRALSACGHTVGFLGDGINDVAALHAADVGISVDTGVDVAKETADLILLDKSLTVIGDGIEQGRRVFVNTLKYVYVTTSANFGNMVSLACATAFLPFLPMLPLQILLLNFLSDVPAMSIATDNVDDERLRRPQRWDIARVRRFMLVFGLLSTSVDLATFAVLELGFSSDAFELRTGWFLVSVLTEIVAILFLRTARHVHRSRPSPALGAASVAVVIGTFALVSTPAGQMFRFTVLPGAMTMSLLVLVGAYALITEMLKSRFASLFA